jgi:hypothetical protein
VLGIPTTNALIERLAPATSRCVASSTASGCRLRPNPGLLRAELGFRPRQSGRHDGCRLRRRVIHDHSKALGHAPIIDRNYCAQHEAKAESAKEVERMKLVHMPDPDGVIFDFRTMAEVVNARLKDEFGARFVRIRGAIKVKCHLKFGVVALAVDQILRHRIQAGPA